RMPFKASFESYSTRSSINLSFTLFLISGDPSDLHSFPTRRSSDLFPRRRRAAAGSRVEPPRTPPHGPGHGAVSFVCAPRFAVVRRREHDGGMADFEAPSGDNYSLWTVWRREPQHAVSSDDSVELQAAVDELAAK